MQSARECVLIGVASPYVYEAHECLSRDGWTVRAFIDNQDKNEGPADLGLVCNLSVAEPALRDLPAFFPLLTPGFRKRIVAQALEFGFRNFPSHADPTAVVASSAALTDGVLINAATTIGAVTQISEYVIINRSVSIGHHVSIAPYATLGPGSILCGSSRIGSGAFIGAGAIINPKVSVGRNAIIGAGAVVVRDIPDQCVAVGNPAKIIKTGIAGYNDAGV